MNDRNRELLWKELTCKDCYNFSTWRERGVLTRDKQIITDDRKVMHCALMPSDVHLEDVVVCPLFERVR